MRISGSFNDVVTSDAVLPIRAFFHYYYYSYCLIMTDIFGIIKFNSRLNKDYITIPNLKRSSNWATWILLLLLLLALKIILKKTRGTNKRYRISLFFICQNSTHYNDILFMWNYTSIYYYHLISYKHFLSQNLAKCKETCVEIII